MLFKSLGSGPLSSQGLGWTAEALTESHPVPSADIPVAPEKWDLALHSVSLPCGSQGFSDSPQPIHSAHLDLDLCQALASLQTNLGSPDPLGHPPKNSCFIY